MEHPIEGLMVTAMNSIQDMVDVNTIVGEPIETANNTTIIPISKVCFGFAAGGSEFKGETIDEYTKKEQEEMVQYRLPFGGGSGAGVNINPVAFLVVTDKNVKLLPVKHTSAIDKLIDYVPDLFDKVNESIEKSGIIKERQEDEEVEDININKIKETVADKVETMGRRRPRKRATSGRTNLTYEFDYTDKKPETHIDKELAEYIEEEEMDD